MQKWLQIALYFDCGHFNTITVLSVLEQILDPLSVFDVVQNVEQLELKVESVTTNTAIVYFSYVN